MVFEVVYIGSFKGLKVKKVVQSRFWANSLELETLLTLCARFILSDILSVARQARKNARAGKQRPTFSQEQTAVLEVEYSGTKYISSNRRRELAMRLQLSETQIMNWFKNRRAKHKRIEKAATDQHIRYGEKHLITKYQSIIVL